MAQRDVKFYTALNAVTANGTGNSIDVKDYRNCIVTIGTSGSTTATIKVNGSTQEVIQDLSAAASISNLHDTVELVNFSS